MTTASPPGPIGNNAEQLLRSFFSRLERLDEEIKALNDDKSEVYQEAKAQGFDVKIIRKLLGIRKKDAAALEEEETLLDIYKRALGMLPAFERDDATTETEEQEPSRARAPAPAREDAPQSAPPASPARVEGAIESAAHASEGGDHVAPAKPPNPDIAGAACPEPAPAHQAPAKPPHPSDADPDWDYEHQGMMDFTSGIHRHPINYTDEQIAAWKRGYERQKAYRLQAQEGLH